MAGKNEYVYFIGLVIDRRTSSTIRTRTITRRTRMGKRMMMRMLQLVYISFQLIAIYFVGYLYSNEPYNVIFE